MKLRPEFEVVKGALLNRNPVPSLDTCVGELLREEQRLATQGVMSHDAVISEPATVAYAAKSRGSSEYLSNLHSYHGNQNIQIADGNVLPITDVGTGVGEGDREGA
ncbi:hypothetical protein QL285_006437 [Trifolium repens]|nr:hypothetical protein QL285_006437 [Trifolium repens]